jgi:putative phosphoribosyl transferase
MFKDRIEAGELLVEKLIKLNLENSYLLAIPRGGIVIALPIAQKLHSNIHVLVTRKIGHPVNPEIAIGAIMPDGSAVWDDHIMTGIGISRPEFEKMIAEEYQEVQRRQILYNKSAQIPPIKGKMAIVIDDGIATGYTIRAAIKWLKQEQASKIIISIPVAPPDIVAELAREVDEVICLVQPDPFWAVGMHYEEFPQTTDQEVAEILDFVKNM